ncbi:MAG: xanthine dehydrogenase family protein molybdopterin-binding subunit [Planctomycetales bacterium]|nr:xanthine dehydrogenase family protein molybdopterin-binding subunit [Planctomycetales bacterium]
MAEYSWPRRGTTSLIDTEQTRIDGVAKASGAAKYSCDINPKGTLVARAMGCPHAHCKIKSIDISLAKDVPGVVLVSPAKAIGDEIQWQGDIIAYVAAETEGAAAEGVAAITVEYEMLDVFVDDQHLAAAEAADRTGKPLSNVQLVNEPGDDEDEEAFEEAEIQRLLEASDVVVEGNYGINVITHMCMEPHGSTCEWNGDQLTAHLSTQNVSGTAGQFADPLGITASDVTVHCDFIGGGFGSKFAADSWGVACAELARQTGRPVRLMLDRDIELKTAGNRPSGFIKVKIGADKNGVVQVWDSQQWGTSGASGGGVSQGVVPYVFDPENRRRTATSIATNAGPQRAWRAPNHPQAAAITHTAYDDVAAALGIDSYDVFLRNLDSVSNDKADVYRAQMERAAELMQWKSKWHAHGKGEKKGSVVTGLGMGIHTWGGGGHNSTCRITIHPDGGVETALGSQDLGTGTRTVIGIVVAETFGLPLDAVNVKIGSSSYPASGPSGGSTTVAGVSESNRRAAQDALAQLNELVAAKLGVGAADLVAKEGRIQASGDASKSLSWKEACALLGMTPLEVNGEFRRGEPSSLSSSQVAGVQMAEVAVDLDTGIVKPLKFVAVQDMGLIINRKTAASQIYGAVIMGIAYSIFEERIMDLQTGAFLNAELADYRLPRLGDIGEIVVDLWEPDSEYERGVVGLGEPPVISPGAAISNAVANATGVRVPVLPLTPQRVLDALGSA